MTAEKTINPAVNVIEVWKISNIIKMIEYSNLIFIFLDADNKNAKQAGNIIPRWEFSWNIRLFEILYAKAHRPKNVFSHSVVAPKSEKIKEQKYEIIKKIIIFSKLFFIKS